MKKKSKDKIKNAGWNSSTVYLNTEESIDQQLPVKFIDDGQYNLPHGATKFPGYLNNPKFPFGVIYPNTAGVYNWMQGDNAEGFKRNKKIQKSDWKYLTKKVTYTVNSHGYRAPEWEQIDWKNSVVLFGDSCTYGIGVSDDETIGYQLEKLLGRPVINLGVGGGSNSLMIQQATHLLKYFTAPYAVANIWSTTNRFRFFTEFHPYDAGSWDKNDGKGSKNTNVSKL